MGWRDTIKKEEIQETSIEEVPKSSWRDTIKKETPQLPEDEVTAPAAGYVAGKATQKAILQAGKGIEKGLEKIAQVGGTSPEQLKVIKQNFPEFKTTDPIAEMNKLLATARGTNVGINQMYQEAEKLLADKEITPDEYRFLVEKAVLEQNKYGQPTFAKSISQSEISKTIQPAIESTQEIAQSKQEKLLKEFADLKAKEAVDRASERAMGVLPEATAKVVADTTREQVLKNPQAFDFKGLSSQEVFPIFEEQRGKLISAKETALAKEFPSLKGTSIVPAEERAFQKILGMPSKADIPGNRLQEMLREFRDVGFTEQGQLSDKPAAAMSTKVREKIAEMSPEAGKLMQAENVELAKLEALEKAGYIKRVGKGINTTIEMPDAQINKIVEDLTKAYDGEKPTGVLENLDVLQKYLPENQLKKLELASVKLAEKRAGDIDYVSFRPLNAILQGLRLRKVSRGIATAPEALSAVFPKTTAAAKLLGKSAYKALPALGAGIGGVAARAAEEALSPETSGPSLGMPEYWQSLGIRNPAEQKARAELSAFQEEFGTQPKTIQQQYPTNLALEGMLDITESPQITKQRELLEKRKQDVLKYNQEVEKVKKAGALAPTYVEAPKMQVLKADNPAEIASTAQAMSAGTDRASQEYGRVLSQIVDASPREKEAILFGLNQQPEFRKLVRKVKGIPGVEE